LPAAQDAREQVPIQDCTDVGQKNADAIIGTWPPAAPHARAARPDVAPGIGHQDVNSAEAVTDGAGHAPNFGLIGHVAPDRQSRAARLGSNIAGNLLERFALAKALRGIRPRTVDSNCGPHAAEVRGYDATQAAR